MPFRSSSASFKSSIPIIEPIPLATSESNQHFYNSFPEILSFESPASSFHPTNVYTKGEASIKMKHLKSYTNSPAAQYEPYGSSYVYTSPPYPPEKRMCMPGSDPCLPCYSTTSAYIHCAPVYGSLESTVPSTMPSSVITSVSESAEEPPAEDPPARLTPADEEEKERKRKRQREYEKTYRKRKQIKMAELREQWINNEIKIEKLRAKSIQSAVIPTKAMYTTTMNEFNRLRMEERALMLDYIALRSLKAWIQIAQLLGQRECAELKKAALSDSGLEDGVSHSISLLFLPQFEFSWYRICRMEIIPGKKC